MCAMNTTRKERGWGGCVSTRTETSHHFQCALELKNLFGRAQPLM